MEDPGEVLKRVLSLWPTSSDETDDARRRLGALIDESVVLHVVKGQWIMMSPIAMRQGTARCLVKDSGHPYLPVFVELKQRPRGWGVVRFEGQCPCCFGVGVNDGEICPLCFGDGWGLR